MKRYAAQITTYWERTLERDRKIGIADPLVERCLALAKDFGRITSKGDVAAIRRFIEELLDELEDPRGRSPGNEYLTSLCWSCVRFVANMDGVTTSEIRLWTHRCFRASARDHVAYYDYLIGSDEFWQIPRGHAQELKELLDEPDPSPKELNTLAGRVSGNIIGSGSIVVRNLAQHAARFFAGEVSAEVGVVTWNMGYWGHSRKHDGAWRWLLEEFRPDVALLQGCRPPAWALDQHTVLFERAFPDSRRQLWGTALVTRGLPTTRVSLTDVQEWFAQLGPEATSGSAPARFRGWCVSAEIDLPELGPVLFISVHNPAYPIGKKLLNGIDISEIKTRRQKSKVWLLDILFYFLKSRLDRALVVGGDFNSSRLLDEPKPTGNKEFFDRIWKEGFQSLHRGRYDSEEQTFFKPGRRPHQLDYLYGDSTIGRRVTDSYVVPYEEVREFSDHAPVAVGIYVG